MDGAPTDEDIHDEGASVEVRIEEGFRGRIDGGYTGHRPEHRQPFTAWAGSERSAQLLAQYVLEFEVVLVGDAVRQAELRAQRRPEVGFDRGDRESPAVGRLVDVVAGRTTCEHAGRPACFVGLLLSTQVLAGQPGVEHGLHDP
ncbi:MAG: hypothetical protein JWM19_7209 [Actinomycetia bacterium]|nr:hypothetical protein [Actinomycetes bacterium]